MKGWAIYRLVEGFLAKGRGEEEGFAATMISFSPEEPSVEGKAALLPWRKRAVICVADTHGVPSEGVREEGMTWRQPRRAGQGGECDAHPRDSELKSHLSCRRACQGPAPCNLEEGGCMARGRLRQGDERLARESPARRAGGSRLILGRVTSKHGQRSY